MGSLLDFAPAYHMTRQQRVLPAPRFKLVLKLKGQAPFQKPAPLYQHILSVLFELQHPLRRQHLTCQPLFQHGRLIEGLRQCLEDDFHNVVRHADNFLEGFLPTRTKVRNASFTDSEVRNILATSGESTTTLLPSTYRLAYFPRTPLLKSYSGSISGRLSRMSFFIGAPFMTRGNTGAD